MTKHYLHSAADTPPRQLTAEQRDPAELLSAANSPVGSSQLSIALLECEELLSELTLLRELRDWRCSHGTMRLKVSERQAELANAVGALGDCIGKGAPESALPICLWC